MTDYLGDHVRAAIAETWVVYRMPVRHRPDGMRGVCGQAEWDAMERANPGVNTLIRGGMTNEGEAERLARGDSGAARVPNSRLRLTSWQWEFAMALELAKGSMVR